ncbi:MAG TPA: hypothetical protein PLX66_01875 [Bacilli bacterium]|nr:hypothetical protein [Bacilli bacterium]
MGYLIKKVDKSQEIVYLDYEQNGYIFKPKNKSETSLTVNEIVVINPSLIDKILTIKFNTLFKKIAVEALKIIYDDDADAGQAELVLGELKRLKSIVLHKYQKFLTAEKEEIFLKKIKELEKELKVKIMMTRQFKITSEENYGRSR